MLNYRTGAMGSPSAATAMADYLVTQSVPRETTEMARYYQGSVEPPAPRHEIAWDAMGQWIAAGSVGEAPVPTVSAAERVRTAAPRGVRQEVAGPAPEVDPAFAVVVQTNERAVQAYEQALWSPGGEAGLEYARSRGWTDETIRHFRLGWAGPGRLAIDGVDDAALEQAGLLLGTENGRTYPLLRNRLVFPIRDAEGQTIGFSGRTLDPNEGRKYVNSPETPAFRKGRSVYGIDMLAAGASVALLEGQADVVSAYQAGVSAGAPLGTAISEDQLRALWLVSPSPVIAMDGDAAGRRAAARVAELVLPFLSPGQSLSFAALPDGEDPDSLIRAGRADEFGAVLGSAQPLSEALYGLISGQADVTTIEGRAALRDRLRDLALKVTDKQVAAEVRGALLHGFYAGRGSDGRDVALARMMAAMPNDPRIDTATWWSDMQDAEGVHAKGIEDAAYRWSLVTDSCFTHEQALRMMDPQQAKPLTERELVVASFAQQIRDGEIEFESFAAGIEALVDAELAAGRPVVDREELVAMVNEALNPPPHKFVYDNAVAEPRRDMDPRYARLMGIDPHRAVTTDQLANLLNGRRTDGEDVPGKQYQRATVSIGDTLGLSDARLPTPAELACVLGGKRADGSEAGAEHAKAVRKLLEHLGVARGKDPTAEQMAHIMGGSRADGTEIGLSEYLDRVNASKTPIGYTDFTFSSDKSVGIAWAFASPAEQAILLAAHREAVDEAMKLVARELGMARRGKGGSRGADAGHVGWVKVDHYSSRPTVEIVSHDKDGTPFTELMTLHVKGDMDVHSHVLTPNITLTEDGHVGGMDLKALEDRVHEFGGFYQAVLATKLREVGIAVELDAEKGCGRITAIPDYVRTHYSKRSRTAAERAREVAREQGLDWDTMSEDRKKAMVRLGARQTKLSKDDGELDFADWKRQADELGWTYESVIQHAPNQPLLSEPERLELAYQTAIGLLDQELQKRSVIDGKDARLAAVRGLIASGTVGPEDIDKLTAEMRKRGVVQNGEGTNLIWRLTVKDGRNKVRMTTELHVDQETELVGHAQRAYGDKSAALTPAAIAAAVARHPELDFVTKEHGRRQRQVMETLGTGGRLGVTIGAAGAGKSSLMTPLVDAWRADGREVFGVSLAWRQADALVDAGIVGRNRAALSVFLAAAGGEQISSRKLNRRDRAFAKAANAGEISLSRNSVVVVDEVGLVGTRQMLDLMRLQDRFGFQLVMIGDPKQAQAVEAGPTIRLLQRALGEEAVPELTTSIRQRTEREREIASLFREGRAMEALDKKVEDGTVLIVPGDYRAAAERVAELWKERRDANRDDPDFTISISAPTNHDAREIGAAVRAIRRRDGEITGEQRVIQATDRHASYDLPLAPGDHVRLFASTRASFGAGKAGNIGRNASVLTVENLKADGIVLRNANGRVGFVTWDTLRDKASGRIQLAYGDVLTIDSSQGSTVTEHIHAMPAGTAAVDGFKCYVAQSRHRVSTWLVTSDGAERREVFGRRPMGDPRPLRARDVLSNMGRNLSRQPEKSSALALLDTALGVQREVGRALRRTDHKAVGRPGTLPERFARSRTVRDVRAMADSLGAALGPRADMVRRLAELGPAVRKAVERLVPRREVDRGVGGPEL